MLAEPQEPNGSEGTVPSTHQAERWMRVMNTLTQVGKALVAELDVKRACSRTVEAALYISGATHAFLLLLNEGDAAHLFLCATRGPHDREVRLIEKPVESRIALRVARSGQALVQSAAPDETALAEAIGHSLGPVVAVPVRWQQTTCGVLLATRDPGEPSFGEADADWLGSLADYAAIAVRNARILEQQRGRPAPLEAGDPRLAALLQELDQIAIELQMATEKVQRLAILLAEDNAG